MMMTILVMFVHSGSDYGLKLTLNVEQYEYMPGPHDAAGVKLLLHDGKEFPSVAELGLAIPTGAHAYVGIQLVQVGACLFSYSGSVTFCRWVPVCSLTQVESPSAGGCLSVLLLR